MLAVVQPAAVKPFVVDVSEAAATLLVVQPAFMLVADVLEVMPASPAKISSKIENQPHQPRP